MYRVKARVRSGHERKRVIEMGEMNGTTAWDPSCFYFNIPHIGGSLSLCHGIGQSCTRT